MEYGTRDYIGRNKVQTGICESYTHVDAKLVRCEKPGTRRVDNGLDAGIHCDEHWERLVTDARKRSW